MWQRTLLVHFASFFAEGRACTVARDNPSLQQGVALQMLSSVEVLRKYYVHASVLVEAAITNQLFSKVFPSVRQVQYFAFK